MIPDLDGKTAFITGGGSGIGIGMARVFGRAGMNVMLADVDAAGLAQAEAELSGLGVPVASIVCDVTSRRLVEEAAQATIARFGKVHVVCNNAGVSVGGAVGTIRSEDWDWIIDVNLKGVVHGVEVFVPLILEHGEGGHIVNTASMAALIAPPGMEPYVASKVAVLAMSEGWAGQLAEQGIGVSVLCPGAVDTEIHHSWRRKQASYGGPIENEIGPNLSSAGVAPFMASGMHPDVVGARVLEAVRANEFYVFTHIETRPAVEARLAALIAGFDAAERSQALRDVPAAPPPDTDAIFADARR